MASILVEHATGGAIHDSKLIPSLYGLSLLFRMGGYFTRVLGAVARHFSSGVVVHRCCDPPDASKKFIAEFGDYFMRNHICYAMQRASLKKARAKAAANKRKKDEPENSGDPHDDNEHDRVYSAAFDMGKIIGQSKRVQEFVKL